MQEREQKLERLREDLQLGLDDLDSGRAIQINDDEEHRAFFDDIKRRGAERRTAQRDTPEAGVIAFHMPHVPILDKSGNISPLTIRQQLQSFSIAWTRAFSCWQGSR